ncbi:AAA family ATPase [Mesorhizobium sp.]|uniref:AAA family ATPase n=1 Tax=Mesorhizobium sp. TaxID=1871066 RepID=UPI0025B8ACEC|nr:AAA family ATPase [Mesorhizobium sp.]
MPKDYDATNDCDLQSVSASIPDPIAEVNALLMAAEVDEQKTDEIARQYNAMKPKTAKAIPVVKADVEQSPEAHRLAGALQMAGRGFKLLPVALDRKKAAHKGRFIDQATGDIEQLRAWSKRYNFGIATEADLLVIDCDIRRDEKGAVIKDGLAHFINLMGGEPDVFTTRTGSGGKQFFFSIDNPVTSTAGKAADPAKGLPEVGLGEGIDIRSYGALVLAPGSQLPGKDRYSVINAAPVAPAPERLLALIMAAAARKKDRKRKLSEGVVFTGDDPRDYAEGTRRALDAAPAIEGQGGDNQTYSVAAAILDVCTEDQTKDIMREHYNPRCVPEWDDDELDEKVENAVAYRENEIGSDCYAATVDKELDVISETDWPTLIKAAADRGEELVAQEAGKTATLTRLEQIEKSIIYIGDDDPIESDPLIEGICDRGTFVLVTGPMKTGKTLNVMDICAHIAVGRQWNSRDVAQGVAIYCLAEGGKGVKRRLKALRTAKNIPADAPMMVCPIAIDLFKSNADVAAVIAFANEQAKKHRLPVQAIVFDTLARSMIGGNESAVEDINVVVGKVDRIREATGSTVFVVTHTGWIDKKRSRGSTALPGAIDAELLIDVDEKTEAAQIVFQNLREYEAPEPIKYHLESIDLGKDTKGRLIKSAVVRYDLDGGSGGDFEHIAAEAETEADVLRKVQERFAKVDTYRAYWLHEDWGGNYVAELLGEDVGEGLAAADRTKQQKAARARVKARLDKWVKKGDIAVVYREVEREGGRSDKIPFYSAPVPHND